MHFSLLAATFALAGCAFAYPPPPPYGNCLSDQQASTIVAKWASILGNQTYDGQSPQTTADQVVAENYREYSDSINSLQKIKLTNAPNADAIGRQAWFEGVTSHPTSGIETLQIVHNCNTIVWYWQFNGVGDAKYRVKGFDLLEIDNQGQIQQANIEFNSIAWGADDGELDKWCTSGKITK